MNVTRTRSEYAANLSMQPETVQAMRNLSALQRMRADGWNVGRSFTAPGRGHADSETLRVRRMGARYWAFRTGLTVVLSVVSTVVLTLA